MKKDSYKRDYPLSPEQYVEYVLCDLQKANKRIRSFHKDYHTYLITQRNLLLNEILQSLKKVGRNRTKGIFYRVVLSQYMDDPLCTRGSLLYSGRFNFGHIAYDYPEFPCLYVSNHPDGAKLEKFPNPSHKILSSEEISLTPKKSFLTSRCEVNLTKCIDVRTPDCLKHFTKIISQINPTNQFQKKWKKMNRKVRGQGKIEPLRTIKTLQELYRSLFEIYYEQWVTFLDIPSNSQWFGYYVKSSGIEAIIYPSIKHKTYYNLAIYPDNFGPKSYVRLADLHKSVPQDRREINKSNHRFFEYSCDNLSSNQ